MEGTIDRFMVKKCVFPTARIITWLVLAVFDVLSEVHSLLWSHVQSYGFSHIFKSYLSVLVFVEPVEQIPALFFGGDEAP